MLIKNATHAYVNHMNCPNVSNLSDVILPLNLTDRHNVLIESYSYLLYFTSLLDYFITFSKIKLNTAQNTQDRVNADSAFLSIN